MTDFWKTWMMIWCAAALIFGVVLAGAAFPQTDGLTRTVYAIISGGALPDNFLDAPALRFSIGLLGAVLMGWALTVFAVVRAGASIPSQVWQGITAALIVWFVIDSGLSIATGFALNAVSNTAFLIAFLVPVLASGVLRPSVRAA